MFMRRRPLARAAMVGGTAYYAGKAGARASQRQEDEAWQDQQTQERIAALEAQQAPPPAAPVAPAGGPTDLAAKLTQLKALADQGVLTPEEFTAAKQKLLAES